MQVGGSSVGTSFYSTDVPFLTAYGYDANNSGVLRADSGNTAISTFRWLDRNSSMVGGLRPCVKIESGKHFNENTLTIE